MKLMNQQSNKTLIMNLNQKEYIGGEKVKILIEYIIDAPEKVKIFLSYKGYEHSEFNQLNGGQYSKQYMNRRYFFKEADILLNSEKLYLPQKGIYQFPYTFELPKNLPPSFRPSFGESRIVYKIKVYTQPYSLMNL